MAAIIDQTIDEEDNKAKTKEERDQEERLRAKAVSKREGKEQEEQSKKESHTTYEKIALVMSVVRYDVIRQLDTG